MFGVAFVLVASVASAQPHETTTAKDVDDAIRLGTYGDPAPYLVHHWQGRGREAKEVEALVVAVVYTPFVRIALAAKAAMEKGITFEPSDVTAAMIEPVAYVAYRWYCCDGVHGDRFDWHPRSDPFNYQIAVPGSVPAHNHREWAIAAKPLWTTREVERFEPLPYPDVVWMVGYAMEDLRTNRYFVIYTEHPSEYLAGGRDWGGRIGHVSDEEVTRWR